MNLAHFLAYSEDGRHFDGASPVDVVEALAEDELLKCLLLQLALTVDHAVVVGHGVAPVGLLTDQEKVVVFAHRFPDYGPGGQITVLTIIFIIFEKHLRAFDIGHDNCDENLPVVNMQYYGF